MRALGVIQARMTSSRLPGKVMMSILGEPSIIHQFRRTQRAQSLEGIVVATSSDPSDDPLADLLEANGVDVVRGSLEDVLERFVQVIDSYQPEAVVRMTADCPLISPVVIDEVVSGFAESGLDYQSNTLRPTFPDGLDVEVMKSEVLRRVAAESKDSDEREHVTLGVYRQPDRFRLSNVTCKRDLSSLRWTVDTPADLEFVRWVYESLYEGKPDFDMDDILELLEKHPDAARTSSHGRRNAALDGTNIGAMQHGSAPM